VFCQAKGRWGPLQMRRRSAAMWRVREAPRSIFLNFRAWLYQAIATSTASSLRQLPAVNNPLPRSQHPIRAFNCSDCVFVDEGLVPRGFARLLHPPTHPSPPPTCHKPSEL
jgi:hypothetical protein